MARNYNWRIKKEYYNMIVAGTKTLEVRVGYPDIRRVKAGDTITFSDYSNIQFNIVRVTRYNDFPDMLDNEDSKKAIPGVSKYKALGMYQAIYDESKEALGVYVFELARQSTDTKVYCLSDLRNNHKVFGKYATGAYDITDHICGDYPKHFTWYWTKHIPRVLSGEGDVIFCVMDKQIAGVSFIKFDNEEKKICTIYVSDKFRHKGIATKLLKASFKRLGTTTPLITIADYKIPMFEHIIKKYNWKHTQTLSKGYYNDKYDEIVYNGKI